MTIRFVDRVYVFFVVLVGGWCLQRYYAFCFTDVLFAVTARSVVITTTTTTHTAASLQMIGNVTRHISRPLVMSHVDERSRSKVQAELKRKQQVKDLKKQIKDAEKELKNAQKGPSDDGDESEDNNNNNSNKKEAEHPKISRSVEVRKLSFKDRITPIVVRDLCWLLLSVFVTVMLVWSYAAAVTTDPGAVPRCFSVYAQKAARMALSTGGSLTKCYSCQVFKPPRCHHCSRCQRCVLKYDHHCYWIGQCVGFFNYKVFFVFCFWTCVFCYVASFSLSRSVYLYFLRILVRESPTTTGLHSLSVTTQTLVRESPILGSTEVASLKVTTDIVVVFVLMFLAGSLSAYMLRKHWALMRLNKTTVEEMVLGDDPSPYDMGATYNLEEVFGDRNFRGPNWLRWILRLLPTLAYGPQPATEVESTDYFRVVREQRRRLRLLQEEKEQRQKEADERKAAETARVSVAADGAGGDAAAESDDTISQPSSSDTDDADRQAKKVALRQRVQHRSERRSMMVSRDKVLSVGSALDNYGTMGADDEPPLLATTPPFTEAEGLALLGGSSPSEPSAVVHLCPQGTHFRKHVEDTASSEEEEEMADVDASPSTTDYH